MECGAEECGANFQAVARGGTFKQGTTAPCDAAVFFFMELRNRTYLILKNLKMTTCLVIAPQEGNLEPERQKEQYEVEPQDDQQEQLPVEPLPLLRQSKRLRSRPDRFGTNIFDLGTDSLGEGGGGGGYCTVAGRGSACDRPVERSSLPARPA